MKAYDFDGTIYDGNSTKDFYLYCFKKDKRLIRYLPSLAILLLKYTISKKNIKYMTRRVFDFLNGVEDIDVLIKEFWNIYDYKIKMWYLDQKRNDDVIISASPDFLLEEICNKMEVKHLIASKIDKNTGEHISPYCWGEEKVKRYNYAFAGKPIEEFYSDSWSDEPMRTIAKKGFRVKKNKIVAWK